MSHFKCDNYYEAHVDEACQDDDKPYSSSDEATLPTDAKVPRHMCRNHREWLQDNYDALVSLYEAYQEAGKQLFGRSFNQQGDLSSFIVYVYHTLQPGTQNLIHR